MADFYIRASLGQFELNSADQLIKLLAKMARNKLINKIRYEKAQQRDIRRLEKHGVDELDLQGDDTTPSQIVAHHELLAQFHSRLSSQDRYIAQQRSEGKSWNELALELGCNSDALRIGFGRAIDRVSQELGLEALYHD